MTVTITPPVRMPDNIDRAASASKVVDNGRPCVASAIRQFELACQHLAAGRKVSAAGCGIWEAITNAVSTFEFKMPRTAYTSRLRVKGWATTRVDDTELTIGVTTATDAVGVTLLITGTAGNTRTDATYWEVEIDCGAGDNTDLGTEDVTVTAQVTAGSGAQTAKSWSITLQPLPEHSPFAETIVVG